MHLPDRGKWKREKVARSGSVRDLGFIFQKAGEFYAEGTLSVEILAQGSPFWGHHRF